MSVLLAVWAFGALAFFLIFGYAMGTVVIRQKERFNRLPLFRKVLLVLVLLIGNTVLSVFWPITLTIKAVKSHARARRKSIRALSDSIHHIRDLTKK